MGDAMQTLVEQAAKGARDVFSPHRQAKDAIDYMEQLIYAALREMERALPAAAPIEDVRAGALKEAAKRISELMLPATNTQMGISYNMGLGVAYDAILALIPEAKP